MIESLDLNSILLFLDSVFLQGDDGGIFGFFGQDRGGVLGSDDPLVKGIIPTMFAVTGFGTSINVDKRRLIITNKLKGTRREFYPHKINHDGIIIDGHTGNITFEAMR